MDPICAICYEKSNYFTLCNHNICLNCFLQIDIYDCPICRGPTYSLVKKCTICFKKYPLENTKCNKCFG